MILRDYQLRAVNGLRAAWASRPICVVPPRGGKTVIAAEVIRLAREKNPGSRQLYIAHRRELVQQAVAQLARRGIEAGCILAGQDERRDLRTQVGSIPTLARRAPLENVGLVMVDECHHACTPQWRSVIEQYPGAALMGFSGTPYRMDGKPLGQVFGAIVQPTSIVELTRLGHLAPLRIFTQEVPDLEQLRVVRGDYEQKKLAQLMRRSSLVGDIVETWRKHGSIRPAVAFAVDRAHSREIALAFSEAGAHARHLDSATPAEERAAIVQGLREGAIDLVSNCEILGEGVDFPVLRCLIIARPTQSMALHRQMVARVMTPDEGKPWALVLDHAGNHNRLLDVSEELALSLTEKVKFARRARTRICPGCLLVVTIEAATCPECGKDLGERQDKTRKKGIRTLEGELVEFRSRESRLAWYASQVATASRAGQSIGWARHQYRKRFGVWPRDVAEIEAAQFHCPRHMPKADQRGRWIVTVCTRCRRELGRGIA